MLGTLDLRDSEDRELRAVLRRPKLLALLGYLAIARPPGFHRRDTLVALLWPELDHAHARNALRQAVYAVREALGSDVVVGRGEEDLGLRDEGFWCDVRQFETALEGGEAEKALDLYRGPLLNGLYMSDAPEFERWLDQEREQLRRRACDAARLLADREDGAGNARGAARWALRLTELSPFDETAVRRLIELLDRAGDRAGALRAYEDFQRRLGRDLEVEPSAETRALVEALRARRHSEAAAGIGDDVKARASQPGPRAAVQPPARVGRRRMATVLALFLGGLLTGGWLFFRTQVGARSAEVAPSPKRLVVLPFANLGLAEDGYFADGIAEEITARLAAIDRLRVIGSTSASAYKGTKKKIPEIGRELGVDYVLEGSIRWQKSGQGPARVRVTLQLVSTVDGTHLWAQVYDEPLDEIFRVQSDIAQKVVQALDITLLEPKSTVEAVPTRNLQAYDYYLRGKDYSRRGAEERFVRAAVRMYEQAVGLDSSFALAYAMLSRAHNRMYSQHYDHSPDRLAQSKWAVDKALALQPDLPEAHHSLGQYYWIGHADYDRALREYAITEARRPNEPSLYLARAVLHAQRGKYPESLADFARALELNPGSAGINTNYGELCDLIRDFGRAESLYDRAIALMPDSPRPYFLKAGLYLRRDGNTERARAVLDEAQPLGVADAPDVVLTRVLIAIFDRRYAEAIARLSAGAPEVFADQRHFTPRAQLYAQVYGLMQRPELERAYYDSARSIVVGKLWEQPDDSRLHSALAIAYAGLGRTQEAVREAQRGVELRPISQDTYHGYYRLRDLARVYVMVGEHATAVDRLEHLLSIPGDLTPAWLRIDPTWDLLRGHPRFQKLVDRGN